MMEKLFRLRENNTTVRTEMMAGTITFLTMAYIIVVQPLVLSGRMFGFDTGMDFGSIMTATCIAAALATAIMGLYARYPIAQAPGMGENFVFVFSVVPAATAAGFQNGWQVALGVVFISGVLFLLLSLSGLRRMIIDALSPGMKSAMAAGIGLFIAFIGLQNAGLIVDNPGTLVSLNTSFASPDTVIFMIGLLLTAALLALRIQGAILWGILATTLLAVVARFAITALPTLAATELVTESKLMQVFMPAREIVSLPPSIAPTFFKMDLRGACTTTMIPFIVLFLFMDLFDTVGTLVGVSQRAGFIKDNKLPRANRAMLSDAVGTVAGACLGTSTVTSFIESAAGVERGGRTGLTSLTTAALFLLALFFAPLVQMIGSYPAITAPALVIVGAMMVQSVTAIQWDDYSESIPCFLTMVGIPLTYSIADGLALGFISYPLVKLLCGRGREAQWLMHVMAVILIAYFVLVRSRL